VQLIAFYDGDYNNGNRIHKINSRLENKLKPWNTKGVSEVRSEERLQIILVSMLRSLD